MVLQEKLDMRAPTLRVRGFAPFETELNLKVKIKMEENFAEWI